MGAMELEIVPRVVPERRLVTAKSFLIDRIVPQCEVVILPERQLPGGLLRLDDGVARFEPKKRRRRSRLRPNPAETVPEGRWAFEMRFEDPENWAHFLNDHLPFFFKAAHATGRAPDRALLLLPSNVPDYIVRAAAMFGLETCATDAVVEGEGVAVTLEPYLSGRTERHLWVRLPYPQAVLEAVRSGPAGCDLPEKVFLIRRGQRALSNHAEIEAWLAERGFVAILPESLSVADQFRVFFAAREMVSLSGACLAPLLYTQAPGQGPERLIELQPCGHMSTVYREMAHLVGCHFVGVRGRIKPEYVNPAYQLDRPFRKFSQDSFHIDPDALEIAFTL